MNKRPFQAKTETKSGVALIVVLGFLSIMIMMAVAFLTHARTERMVADATIEAQRGRELVRTALNAAMNDYSLDLFGNLLLLPTKGSSRSSPRGNEIFTSIPPTTLTDADRTIGEDNIRLMAGEARRWLPRHFFNDKIYAVSNAVADAEWILVRETNTTQSRIVGRYAYACFDMSGGIDANLIARDDDVAKEGNATNRFSVRSVGMGELAETADASEFKRLRTGWHGFDNLAELILLTNGKYNGGEQEYEEEDDDTKSWAFPGDSKSRWRGSRQEAYGAALTSSEVTDLVPYSLAAYRGVYDYAAAKWRPPAAVNEQTKWDEVLAPVEGQLVAKADTVKALKDYFDQYSTAQEGKADYPSSEAVPMFNELKIEYYLTHQDAVVDPPAPERLFLIIDLDIETWYPFPSDKNEVSDSYTITAPTISGGSASLGEGDIGMIVRMDGTKIVTLEPVSGPIPASLTVTPDFNDGLPKTVTGGPIHYEFEIKPVNPADLVTASSTLRVVGIRNKNPILMKLGDVADQMQVKDFQSPPDATIPLPHTKISYEAIDPRLNHDKNDWQTTTTPSMAPEAPINAAAISAGYGAKGGEGLYMYCRNGPMQTPAELGFISTGRPWETIDLCTSEGVTMMSKIQTDPTIAQSVADMNGDGFSDGTFYTNGTINPNTASPFVLKAAFAGLKTGEVPGLPADFDLEALTVDEANDLALSMIDESKTKKIQAGLGAFVSPADWARSPAMQKNGALASGRGLNKNQRESLIRNTWGLFSPDNSLFTVLVIGQAIKEGPGKVGVLNLGDEDMITGERRAVALVWRDPFPSASGHHHEMFVRMFKFLDE